MDYDGDQRLQKYVQTLAKRLQPDFEQIVDPIERIKLVCLQPESGEQLMSNIVPVPASPKPKRSSKIFTGEQTNLVEPSPYLFNWPQKNEDLAKRNREDGNKAFQAANFDLALLLYSEAMRFGPVHELTLEGEDFAVAASNRSATFYQLRQFERCLDDIELALEAGYPTSLLYKLFIRQCKCLLELGKIGEAQAAFDKAVDAIDRSGLKKDLRKGIAAELQGAFINLAKTVKEDDEATQASPLNKEPGIMSSSGKHDDTDNDDGPSSGFTLPPWTQIMSRHPNYPSASEAISINFSDTFGRHVVARRDIQVGEVLFREDPIVWYHCPEDDVTQESCHHCFRFLSFPGIPCPTCSKVVFCTVKCRRQALESYHRYECRLEPLMSSTGLPKVSLITLALRAVVQKPVEFFLENRDKFKEHNVLNGVAQDPDNGDEGNAAGAGDDQRFLSGDYRNLFNLVNHNDSRSPLDTTSKTVFAAFFLQALKATKYFVPKKPSVKVTREDEYFIGHLLLHFIECFQFNTHRIDSIYLNRLIGHDAETRMWKDANQFCIGEFVETVGLGAGIYPTLANVNHSCDPNIILVNMGLRTVAIANRPITAGEQIFDTYGCLFSYMPTADRQITLKNSHWFECGCNPCLENWPIYEKIPRDYLKLPGTSFKYKRCNRKELQKDVDKLKKKIRNKIQEGNLEAARALFNQLAQLLDELVLPPHQDLVNIQRGMKTCIWLQSPNCVKVKEDELLKKRKEQYHAKQK
ncbi:hypothetical protein TCAL_03792 [Tigriopus californicus]|uniref:Protein-lysine N-methyltransferase SMYD4 n=1 Tax=Tigriopus californicus TaxID=6832 RepID=A0A553NU20_TIGCA|nr:SET and MYND domain-containing protein 4-like [Tigriopus californicus]TRY68906.1 hypothetical protein TCAL_03792 [Tigriopus californicus]